MLATLSTRNVSLILSSNLNTWVQSGLSSCTIQGESTPKPSEMSLSLKNLKLLAFKLTRTPLATSACIANRACLMMIPSSYSTDIVRRRNTLKFSETSQVQALGMTTSSRNPVVVTNMSAWSLTSLKTSVSRVDRPTTCLTGSVISAACMKLWNS